MLRLIEKHQCEAVHVAAGEVELTPSATITDLRPAGHRLELTVATLDGERGLVVDAVVRATGFRPDLALVRELRLDLDPAVEAPSGRRQRERRPHGG